MDEINLKEKNEIQYFEDEMSYLLKAGEEFSKKYPTVAGNLELTREGSTDPHVQQILESFAFLGGTLQKQIDTNTHILSRSLVEALFPNLTLPIPSMSVVELQVNPSNISLLTGTTIPRNAELVYSSPYNTQLKFRTVYDTPLYPAQITGIKIGNGNEYDFLMGKGSQVISIDLKLFDGAIKKDLAQKIRFYINMRRILANKFYDIVFTNCKDVYIYSDENYYNLGTDCLSKVGFEENETLDYYTRPTYDFSKTMQEYFLLPEKFLFFDVDGIDVERVKKKFSILLVCDGIGKNFNLELDNLKLRCTPIINVFSLTSEPVATKTEKNEYILYTNYLKSKFLFFHSINKLKYLEDTSEEKEINPVTDYIYFKLQKENSYYYEVKTSRLNPNEFKLNLYNNKGLIFIENITLYADILATNGIFCEKMDSGEQLSLVKETHVKSAELLKPPTYYIENDNSNEYYWTVLSRLYSEKLTLYDEGEFLRDLKSIIKTKISVNLERENIKSVIDNINNVTDAIEGVTIKSKSFKLKNDKKYFFVRGKEVHLTVFPNKILSESIVMLAEAIFSILNNITEINNCVSLLIVEKSTQKVLYTCMPKNGKKKSF